MDIVRFKGGLGNQMFQYALVEALRSYGRDVGCNLGFYRKHPEYMQFCLKEIFPDINLNEVDDKTFNLLDNQWIEIKKDKLKLEKFRENYENRFFWVEDKKSDFDQNIFKTQNCVFVGYWQTEKYFKNAESQIRKLYTFQAVENKLIHLSKELGRGYCSVHIRRQDYLKVDNFMGICTAQYYKKAMDFIEEKNKAVKFIFFSDDIEWVKQNLRVEDAIYCERELFDHYQDWYDMYLMSKCCGNIIANSSFSWWGAWLNENPYKIVIAPNRWQYGYDRPDICPDNWVRLEG